MTKAALIDNLKVLFELQKDGMTCDPTHQHMEADKLLLQFIDDPAVTDCFNAIEKWYK